VLYLGLLLHDIAKGRKEDHSIAGMKTALTLCPRLGFTPGETQTVAWLVEQHLLMSSVAQSRDLTDARTIEKFASVVQTIERLKMLFVLTVCDINAVGPGVLDAWKAQLLRQLYWETEVVLGGGHSAVDRRIRVAEAKAQLRAALKDWSDEEFENYAKRHYPAYWLKMDLAHKIYHARLLRQLADARAPLVAAVALDNKRGATELTVIARIIAGCSRPSPALRGLRRQYRRRAYFHHRRRIGARHHRMFARFLIRRRRTASRRSHRRLRQEGAARRGCGRRRDRGAERQNAAGERFLDRAGSRHRQQPVA